MDNRPAPAILRPMTGSSDALIIGGSLTGATLALALARAGLTVTVLDSLPAAAQRAANFDGRSYALAHASVRMLEALGLWADLAANAQPIRRIRVSDGRAGAGPGFGTLSFDGAELEEGEMGHMVEDRHLRPALQAALTATAGITHRPATKIAAQRAGDETAEVTTEAGEVLSAPLLIGADGRTGPSASRAGIARRTTRYSQTALVCAIAHEKPHHGTAHQFFMPEGPLAILPLTGNRASIVWSERADRAAAIAALADAAYLAVLRPRFGDFLGPITLAGDRYSYPLSLALADRLVAPRFALVGDAARGVHPIAGQGLNAGLRDGAALAEVVVAALRRGEDIGGAQVLERYARWRRFDSASLALATDGFNALFSNDNPLLRFGRGLGLAAVNAAPGLRRAFMREAAGLTGDRPRLLAGQPL